MQPGPFNKNIQNQDFYNSIADAVMKINREAEEAKIQDSPISELKMPQRDARGNVKSRKVRGAYQAGSLKASDQDDKHLQKSFKASGDTQIDHAERSIAAGERSNDRFKKGLKREGLELDELVMPQRDARGNVKSRKVRAAFAKGADNAQGASNRAMDKALGSKGNRPEIDSTINNIDKSIAADDRRDDRNRNARKEEVEFTDETYVAGENYDKNKHIIQRRTHPHTGKPVNVLVSKEKGNQGKIVGKFMKVAEGKLVDRVMKKRKEMKNKGTIPGSDGY